ncbi:Signal transduction response regulator receiver domain [Arabidopsis suecica]|uniref:Signal transduction response regulator receiver domain n=1 Tax=Arabidopsis suecica TaxID=45249 RepID=A0A8T2C187_ARASU|nr:Signal transduction response regulator receiver domain [Arabidopsis suecica]
MIEKQKKDIGLIIANIEMFHIDADSFLTVLLHKDIPLILINPEIKTKKPSDLLRKRACFSLDQPISENDIKNIWQHVLPKKIQESKKINMTIVNQENVREKDINQIEVFRASLKRQRTSQASLLGRQPFIDTFTISKTSQKRKSRANVEWKTKPSCLIEIENKRKEWKKRDSSVIRRRSLWTNERHMKFLAAISILDFRPKSILTIMNDPNLTYRQVGSHLQKYKAQIERISDTLPRNECKSTDETFEYHSEYKYPFKTSDLLNNLIAILFKKPIAERKKNMPKFHVGGKSDLSNHSLVGNIFSKSSINVNYVPSTISNNPPYNIVSTDNANHTSLVSTSLGSENLPILSGLPSNVRASHTCAFQMESTKISIPQYDPNPFHPPRSVLENDVNQIDLDFTSTPDSFHPLADLCTMNYTMNPFETNIDQMDWLPFIENHSHHEINMNHMDWDHSIENFILLETGVNINFPEKHTNQMDWVSSGEGYVPFENVNPFKVDISQMDMGYSGGSILLQEETNTNNVGFVSSEIRYDIPPKTDMTILETNYSNLVDCVFPKDISSLETNTIQKDLVSCKTSFAPLDNIVPLEANMEEMNYVPYDESCDDPIEDLISFDINVDEKDMPSWLEDSGFSERDNMMKSCEYHNVEIVNQRDHLKGEDNFEDYRDNMDWIYEVMNIS